MVVILVDKILPKSKNYLSYNEIKNEYCHRIHQKEKTFLKLIGRDFVITLPLTGIPFNLNIKYKLKV